MRQLHERVAVVTGAASGIGRALAMRFHAEGMRVVAADIDEAGLAGLASELETLESGERGPLLVPTDVSREDDVRALAERTLAEFGAVHLLCNNAGIASLGRLWETSLEDWKRVLDVNLYGVVHGIRTFVPILLEQGEPAHIVNTASVAGLIGGKGIGPYRVSKHAVVALSETLHHELRGLGSKVGVSVLCPGFVRTGILEAATGSFAQDAESRELQAGLQEAVDGGGRAEEVADHVLQAVLDERFYVLPHSEYKAEILKRVSSIVEERDPALF